MEKKDVYIGFVSEPKTYDSGVVKYSVSFKAEQLEELKKYLTASGNVNIDFVIKTDGGAFMSVFNPRAQQNAGYSTSSASKVKANASAGGDLPF